MLTYIWRQELASLLIVDPVLHYYPLVACYQELRAPATVWKDEGGTILGSLLPCDLPGRAWLTAASNEVVAALVREVPPELAITFPLWAESVVKATAPGRTLSTEAIAVCTPATLQCPPPRSDLRVEPVEMVPGSEEQGLAAPAFRLAHLGCLVGDSLAGFCTYYIDGRGGGSIEQLVIGGEWLGADIGKTLLAGATMAILEEAERVVFAAAGDNQALLGVARAVGFRTCYWLRSASPDGVRGIGGMRDGGTEGLRE